MQRRADLAGQGQGARGVVDADLAIMAIRLDPGRMPVALARVVDRVHHEGVDVGDRQSIAGEGVAEGLLLLGQHIGRPGVRHVGHHLDALVADGGQPLDGLREGVIQVGVGAEGQLHGKEDTPGRAGGEAPRFFIPSAIVF